MCDSKFDIQVSRIFRLANNKILKAFVDIKINDALVVKSLRVLDGKNGLFVSMPQEQAKDQKWYDRVRCLTKDLRSRINDEVLAAYHAEVM